MKQNVSSPARVPYAVRAAPVFPPVSRTTRSYPAILQRAVVTHPSMDFSVFVCINEVSSSAKISTPLYFSSENDSSPFPNAGALQQILESRVLFFRPEREGIPISEDNTGLCRVFPIDRFQEVAN